MFIVGLTGGISSGKSTVSNIFRENDIPVIDADVLAREVVEPGKKAWKKIRENFGSEVFKEDGQLDREALGKLIFTDVKKRALLNKITHPEIQKEMFRGIFKCFFQGHQFIVLDIPLLFETERMLPFCHKVITVFCEEDIQIQRLMDRNKYTQNEAKQRISAQLPLSKKCDKSDFVISNSGSLSETRDQTIRILKYLKDLDFHWRVRVFLSLAILLIVMSFIGLVYAVTKFI